MNRKTILAILISIGIATTGTWFGVSKHYQNKLDKQKSVLDNGREESYSREEKIHELNTDIENMQERLNELNGTIKEQRQQLLEISTPKPNQVSTKKMEMELTFYTPTGNRTASGTIPQEGRTVASNSLPLGTKVLINGNTYIVEDRGGMADNVIDIFVESYEKAIQLGRQKAVVEVL